MPQKHGLVVHLPGFNARIVAIRSIERRASLKIEDQQPCLLGQYSIRLGHNLEKVAVVAQVEAETKYYYIERFSRVWQAICSALAGSNTPPDCR
jgi:hypothetical protein